MNAYVKYFDKNSKYMILLVIDEEILEKYNKMWNEIKSLFHKKFDNEPVYNSKYIKTKMHLYDTNFYSNETPIESEHYRRFCNILRFYC